ncbi:MAG TPA: DNA polymerase/3'-5' exonuclease PolX [Thermodesulfobacteriota bacterium]
MKNLEVARLFDLMADLLELSGGNRFRIRAYRRAARNIESLAEDLETVAAEGRLDDIPGVGEDLAGKIAEYLATGRIRALDGLRAAVPAGVADLLAVPGIGPKTAMVLYEKAGVRTIDRLRALAQAGKLRGLPGIQAKTEANILRGIAIVEQGRARVPLGRALLLAEDLVRALEAVRGVDRVALAGSIRRGKETVGDIDILVTAADPNAVMAAFVDLPQVAEVLERGTTRTSVRHRDGIQVDLRVVEPASFGAALQYFTGSAGHNIRIREMAGRLGLKVSEYGVFREDSGRRVAAATEEDVYAAVGLPFIPPELREDAGEIEAALAGRLPSLVEPDDIRGDLHCHTRASDGHHSVDELVAAAAARGYAYVAVTDHSASATIAHGLSREALPAHLARIRAAEAAHPRIRVLAGTECDILPDGRMDYPDEQLARFDLVIAAVHSRLRQSKAEMTRRICRALANPYVHVLAHPTGRLFGERAPYEVDLDAVLRTARRFGKAVEINCCPQRLDLDGTHARRARDLGVLVAIDTDTHALDQLGTMRLGVTTARRGWVGREQVVNAWPLERLLAFTRGPRAGAAAPARRAAGRR